MAGCGAPTGNVFILEHLHEASLNGKPDMFVVNNVFWMSVVHWQARESFGAALLSDNVVHNFHHVTQTGSSSTCCALCLNDSLSLSSVVALDVWP